jgi:hypothetical protein
MKKMVFSVLALVCVSAFASPALAVEGGYCTSGKPSCGLGADDRCERGEVCHYTGKGGYGSSPDHGPGCKFDTGYCSRDRYMVPAEEVPASVPTEEEQSQ